MSWTVILTASWLFAKIRMLSKDGILREDCPKEFKNTHPAGQPPTRETSGLISRAKILDTQQGDIIMQGCLAAKFSQGRFD